MRGSSDFQDEVLDLHTDFERDFQERACSGEFLSSVRALLRGMTRQN